MSDEDKPDKRPRRSYFEVSFDDLAMVLNLPRGIRITRVLEGDIARSHPDTVRIMIEGDEDEDRIPKSTPGDILTRVTPIYEDVHTLRFKGWQHEFPF